MRATNRWKLYVSSLLVGCIAIALLFFAVFRSPFTTETVTAWAISVTSFVVFRVYATVMKPFRMQARRSLMVATPLRIASAWITVVFFLTAGYAIVRHRTFREDAPWLFVVWSGYALRFGNVARVLSPENEWEALPVAFVVGAVVSGAGGIVPLLRVSSEVLTVGGVLLSAAVLLTIPEFERVVRTRNLDATTASRQ